MPRPAWAALLVLALGCASGGGPPPEDATHDPEFQRALRDREPDFRRQREALEAGLYEPFVPPDSVVTTPAVAETPRTGAAQTSGAGGSVSAAGEDPTTEELLRTLPAAPREPAPAAARARAAEESRTVEEPRSSRERAAGAPLRHAEPAVDPTSVPDRADDPGGWTVQLGAFADPAAAHRRAEEARAAAPEHAVALAARAGLTRVLLGRFASRADAEAVLRDLELRGLAPAWVTMAGP